jgi:hypothetical protein
MSYATLSQFKEALQITDASQDTALQAVLDATDDLIDNFCDQAVGFGRTASQTRYYTAEHLYYCITDPIVSVSSIATDDDGNDTYETTWSATDYILAPKNAPLDNEPYTEIDTSLAGQRSFPLSLNGVRVIGVFGWPSVPSAVVQAALIQAGAVWSSRSAPYGVIGSNELGGIMRLSRALHPEAQVLLERYRSRLGLVGG